MTPLSTYTQDMHIFQIWNRQGTIISWWPPVLAVTWRGHRAKGFCQGNREGAKVSVA